MNLKRFTTARESDWMELRALSARAGTRPERLSPGQIRRLGALYRSSAADLARARREFPGDPIVGTLEDLVGQARSLIYDSAGRRQKITHFFATEYWRLIAQRRSLLALAASLFFGLAALAWLWALNDPAAARGVVPEGFLWVTEDQGTDMGLDPVELVGFSTYVMVNNIQVTFLAFALGLLAGIGTGYVLVTNGLILGAVSGLALEAGNGSLLVAAIVGHGVLELSCIVVGGMAGLALGWSILRPNRLSRRQSLANESNATMRIVLGTVPWLVVAGFMEGFLSRVGIGPVPVAIIGITSGILFWGLVWVRGFRPERDALSEGRH